MLSRTLYLVPQSFTHCGVRPRMLYTHQRYWKHVDNTAKLTNIVSRFIDEPQYLLDITQSKGFNILDYYTTTLQHLTTKEMISLLRVYKPTIDECTKIFNYLMSARTFTADIYDVLIHYYPELSQLITQDNISTTYLYHKYRNIPIPQYSITDLFVVMHMCTEEFLYIYPTQTVVLSLSYHKIITIDVRILTLLLDTINPDLYPVAYWRVYGKFPQITSIDSFNIAYYVRKYDPELYRKLDKNIIYMYVSDLEYIDMSTDLEVMLDIGHDCIVFASDIINYVNNNSDNHQFNHWLAVVIYTLGYRGGSHITVQLDDCNACRHFISKI